MTYSFGKTSTKRLASCHEDIQAVMALALSKSKHDFSIAEGHRGQEEQDRCFASGASKVRFPGSYHNETPSLAVDVVPYDKGAVWGCDTYEETQAWKAVETAIKEAAGELDVKLEWGFDLWGWDRPHFQLTEYR